MLKDILIQQIKRTGPIDLYTYMTLCQTHPIYGYYTSKKSTDILGNTGDFVTAPEVSPLFGEMIALWVFERWEALGKPDVLQLVELGPGQGVLMQDILHTLKKLHLFTAKCSVHFVELNPSFQKAQKEKIQSMASVFHYDSINFLGEMKESAIIIANEFFDALPVRQYVNQDGVWYQVGIDIDDDALKIAYFPLEIPPKNMECQPDTEKIFKQICNHVDRYKGAFLVVDYGYWEGKGESLQAVYKHNKVGILDYPGQSDLSVHINFQEMARYCKQIRLHYNFRTQRQFLMDFGIQLRLELMCRKATVKQAIELQIGVQRLINPAEMGQLFKVLEVWKY